MAELGPAGYNLIAYGGNAEDVVLMRAFANRREGFFVDVGAGQPVSGSLTKNLVDRLGWRGINIEPLPERFERLRAARPHDVNLRMAIGSEPGTATFFRIVPGPGMQGGGGAQHPRCRDRRNAPGRGLGTRGGAGEGRPAGGGLA